MGNRKGKKRTFGAIRKLPSGRFQARYPGPDGVMRPAPKTFATSRDADDWLAEQQTEIKKGGLAGPRRRCRQLPGVRAPVGGGTGARRHDR